MESYRVVNKVPTKVLAFGKGIGDDLLDVKNLIVVFPGNPGVIDFYREFMKELYIRMKSKYPKMHVPVWGISHAGHQTEGAHEESTFPHLSEFAELYSLEGQCTHKVKFLEAFVPPHINVIGIGHSIGCKIWMEAMKRLDDDTPQITIAEPKRRPKVSRVFMLFPAIERLRYTTSGQRVQPLLKFYRYLVPLLWPLTLLPTFVQKWIVDFNLKGKKVPECVYPATLQLFNYDIVSRIAFMAKCEFEQVVDLDVPGVTKYLDKLFFYFGTKDHWCPLSFVEEMIEKFPGLNHKICENGFEHAFVLEDNVGMSQFICDQIVFPGVSISTTPEEKLANHLPEMAVEDVKVTINENAKLL